MKHKHSNRILGRTANHRRALLKNLTSALLEHGSIITTQAKAKELRRHFEPLITKAKQDLTLARRRLLLSALAQPSDLDRLTAAAKASASRPGGYLRLTHLPVKRTDAAPTMRVDIIDLPHAK